MFLSRAQSLRIGGSREQLRFYNSRSVRFGYKPKASPLLKSFDEEASRNRAKNANLLRLVSAYRGSGHSIAKLDPLGLQERKSGDLELGNFFFSESDLGREYDVHGCVYLDGRTKATLSEVVDHLQHVYTQKAGYEFSHLQSQQEREWFAERLESGQPSLTNADLTRIALSLLESQALDQFMTRKFPAVKRYGAEGAESMIVLFEELFRASALNGVEDIIIGMQHRGRLNLMTGPLGYSRAQLFSKVKGREEYRVVPGFVGDVLSHLYVSTFKECAGHKVNINLLPNPSHLEAVNPVALGKARARLLSKLSGDYDSGRNRADYSKVLCVQCHGDAAFSGQGVSMESLSLMGVPMFEVGGSVHIITNNQIGFTTPQEQGRTGMYCSDLAKMNDCPVIHVNADSLKDVVAAAQIATEYRQKFCKDIFVDLVCYRKWGHNEVDDPFLTQPVMYEAIGQRRSIPDTFVQALVDQGLLPHDGMEEEVRRLNQQLEQALVEAESFKPPPFYFEQYWRGLGRAEPGSVSIWNTGYPTDLLLFIGQKSVEFPTDFAVHSHLNKMYCQARISKLKEGVALDWGTAEALAIGSLLVDGHHVRISGQDVGRGTFSHRHAMLVDQKTDHIHVPLNHISSSQTGFLEIANSPLSELAVLAFEYGMSLENPNNLIIWEAQFGDFFNGAQVTIDTFISSGESKWGLQSGLVLLLPTGFDGTGPEHSSCRLERFLQMSESYEDKVDGDNVNWSVVNPTTPAQYFHLLRRQIVRNYRKPLVVASPKLILRYPSAVSSLEDMKPGTHFQPVIDDYADPASVRRVIFCSGKHFYALDKHRQTLKRTDVAIVRLEELVPFPAEHLKTVFKRYYSAKEFLWSQEDHRNMGPWTFVQSRFRNLLGYSLRYTGREVSGTPAVGIKAMHEQEAEQVVFMPFA